MLSTLLRSIVVAILVVGQGSSLQAQNAVVQSAIDAVDVDSLVWHLQRLSGEEPIDVGNGDELILSRHTNNAGNALAAVWLQQQLTAMGYTPSVQTFGTTGQNILATKTGAVHPERKVVICGHYDAMPGGPVNAPAADDDGSGTCAVLEAARVLAPYTFENTIVFAMWDQEEQGLIGSHYYAGAAAASDEQIIAAVNMDAISYDGNGDGLLRIHTKPIASSIALKDSAVMVNTTYGLDLPIAINNPGATYSDHASFWTESYSSILIIEDFDNDGNPHYHTPTDLLEYLDQGYWRGLAQLGIGTCAVMAVPYDNTTSVSSFKPMSPSPLQLCPNPVWANGTVRFTTDVPGPVRLSVLDPTGRELLVLHDGVLAAGKQSVNMDVQSLMPATYLLRLVSGKMISSLHWVRTP